MEISVSILIFILFIVSILFLVYHIKSISLFRKLNDKTIENIDLKIKLKQRENHEKFKNRSISDLINERNAKRTRSTTKKG